jgi:prepilin peptidase CpaA
MLLLLIKITYVIINLFTGLYDFSFFRIPNLFLGVLVVMYGIFAPFYLGGHALLNSLILFAIILLLSFVLFYFKIIGGGDAKYISVTSLWVGPHEIINYLFLVSLVGGGLAIIYLLLRDHISRLSDWAWTRFQNAEKRYPYLQSLWIGSGAGSELGKRENIDSRSIPYGVAIAIGAIFMMVRNPLTF